MSRYAENTTVPTDSSRAEIERTLQRYGASSFAYGWHGRDAVVTFEVSNRRVRISLLMPDQGDPEFTKTPARGTSRSGDDAYVHGRVRHEFLGLPAPREK